MIDLAFLQAICWMGAVLFVGALAVSLWPERPNIERREYDEYSRDAFDNYTPRRGKVQ